MPYSRCPCIALIIAFRLVRSLRISAIAKAYSRLLTAPSVISSVFSRRASTESLLASSECSDKQKCTSPSSSKRFLTTSSAAFFSATNSTFLSLYKALAIRLVIVCDLPVPGGPCRTKLSPLKALAIATSCDESALEGTSILYFSATCSILASVISSFLGVHLRPPCNRLSITLFCASSAAWL